MSTTILLDLDCLIAAHEAQPDTKAQRSAWEYLSELTVATMRGNAYIILSAEWTDATYSSTAATCTCEGYSHGRYCWHREAAATLDLARENAAIEQADQREYTPLTWTVDAITVTNTQRGTHCVSYSAAQASGLSELF